MSKNLYFFDEGDGSNKKLLGGKGAGLCTMTQLGLPVPPGFVITTEVCKKYYENGMKLPDGLIDEVKAAMKKLEDMTGKLFGDSKNPLLVSIRSGSMLSMPGMMDTILNLGLNDETVRGLARLTKNERFAYDAYRRFIQMFGKIVLGVDGKKFDEIFEKHKEDVGAKVDTDLTADDLKKIAEKFKLLVEIETGSGFPSDPHKQLEWAIQAVFRSWNNKRAIEYRNYYKIPHDLGTAVNVVTMVFGNMGEDCGTGVAFTRDPATGERRLYGEFLFNAQGEDVVAGIRTPLKIDELKKFPELYSQLLNIADKLEKYYRDMQDTEFTVEHRKLYMLQTRSGKRTAPAAVKIAVDMVEEGLITKEEAIMRVESSQVEQLLHKQVDPRAKVTVIAKGLNASPGAAIGKAVFDAERAKEMKDKGEKVILVRPETNPDDVGGIIASQGVLTSRGGATCVAEDVKILTNMGFIPAKKAHELVLNGENLRILSFDHKSMRPIWRKIVNTGSRRAKTVKVTVSQKGNSKDNYLEITPDHKMYVIENRGLRKKPLENCLKDQDFLCVLSEIPSLGSVESSSMAYLAGAIFTDGYVEVRPKKGRVVFIQKNAPEKEAFVRTVEDAFEDEFGLDFRRDMHSTVGVLDGRLIESTGYALSCRQRAPALALMKIWDNLPTWVLGLDRGSLLEFLGGVIDGDGCFHNNRIHIFVGDEVLLHGIVLACLRLGILPQITRNLTIANVKITERIDELLGYTKRVMGKTRGRRYGTKLLSVKALFADIADEVNYMGRVKGGIRRNLLFDVKKMERDILPLCVEEVKEQLKSLFGAPLRNYRCKMVEEGEETTVYNFEVEADDELDKNFIAFTTGYTPVLISNSHASVVARGLGKPAVVGCEALKIDLEKRTFKVGNTNVKEGDLITINGSTGDVILGEAPLIEPKMSTELRKLLEWADSIKKLQNWANADYPRDAEIARGLGAQGIGLCRTEHMFFEKERLPLVREMILARTKEERARPLEKLQKIQKEDFKGIFRAMDGLPVVIRLLDPPLHEFLPRYEELLKEVIMRRMSGENPEKLAAAEELLKRVEEMREANPMLGLRGCRLGIIYPEINEMQVRAIFEAVCELKKEGMNPRPEIMIPLVGHVNELKIVRGQLENVAKEVMEKMGVEIPYKFGTMIEVPRAALTADEIAEYAEFFSFGTNDLTQMTFAYSRDDAEGKFLFRYIGDKILESDPYQTLDQKGVGRLMRMAIELGRGKRPDLKVGICGEHGGDPASIEFCHQLGLNYVSCSPFRIPVARIAAARSALKTAETEKMKYL